MKHFKITAFLVILILASIHVKAQNDIVRLQNGSVIRGTIIEYIVGDHVRIKTEEGNVYEYKSSEVLRTSVEGKGINSVKPKGYYNITSLGLAIGNGNHGLRAAPSLTMVNGWKWNSRWMTGLGAGLELMNDYPMLPLYADTRYLIMKENFTPFVGAMAGYNVSLSHNNYQYYDFFYNPYRQNKGGPTAGIQFGFISNVGEHLGITANFGYRFQSITTTYNDYFYSNISGFDNYISVPVKERQDMHRITMSFGLLFD